MADLSANASRNARFDWLMALLGLWFEGGLFLDLWAHSRLLVARNEGFFTPWHIVFYSGFLAVAGALVVAVIRNGQSGTSWRAGIPPGYGLAVAGIPLFAASGIADFIKHTLYGFDLAAEAPINPSHLGITLGMGLLVSGPLRSAWSQRMPGGGALKSSSWSPVLSLAGIMTSASVLVQFSSPLANAWADPSVVTRASVPLLVAELIGISGMVIYAALLTAFLLPIIHDGGLRPGGLLVAMGIHAALMTIQFSQYRMIPAALIAGLAYDGLARLFRETRAPWKVSAVGIAVPLAFFLPYFAILALTSGIAWLAHAWTGTLILIGAVGWGMSLWIRQME